MRRSSILVGAIAIAIGLVAASAGVVLTPEAASANSSQSRSLTLLQWQEPSTLNPYLALGTKDRLASSLVLEPLAEIAPDGTLVPALAVEIPTLANGGISADLTQITWTLQSGVLWSDGSPFTADDVVFTWEYCTDCNQFSGVASVVANDDVTVTVTFDVPMPYPYVPFVGYVSPIIQKAQFLECVGEAALECEEQNLAPVGTGPYVVSNINVGESVSYRINPKYRLIPDGKPFFKRVTIETTAGPEAAARDVLENSKADYAWNVQVAPDVLEAMEAQGNGTLAVGVATNVEHINLNQTNPNGDPPSGYDGGANPHPVLFENTVLHEALSMAIDRDEIVQIGYGPFGVPTCNIWNVGAQTSTNNDWCLTQDIAGANALLDANGYLDTDSDGVRETPEGLPLEFEFVTSTNFIRQDTQALLQGYWDQIGVNVAMSDLSPNWYFNPFDGPDSIWHFYSDMNMFTNGAARPDAPGYLEGWTIDQIPDMDPDILDIHGNIPRLANATYDALHESLSEMAFGDPARDALVIQMNDIIVDYSTIPLVNRGSVSAFSNTLTGYGDLNGWDSEYWNIEDWSRTQ